MKVYDIIELKRDKNQRLKIVFDKGVYKVISERKFLFYFWKRTDLTIVGDLNLNGQRYLRGDYVSYDTYESAKRYADVFSKTHKPYTTY